MNAVRTGGWAAILTILAWVDVIAMVPDGNFDDMPAAALAGVVIGSVAMMVAFYGLYTLYRTDRPLAGAMLATSITGLAISLIPTASGVTYSIGTAIWGAGIVLFGLLVHRADGSEWLAGLSYVAGAFFVVVGAVYLAGADGVGDALNMAASVPTFAWTIWVARLMLAGSRRRAAVTA